MAITDNQVMPQKAGVLTALFEVKSDKVKARIQSKILALILFRTEINPSPKILILVRISLSFYDQQVKSGNYHNYRK